MDISILKSDIFFVVATICFVVLSILIAIILVYAIRVARDIKIFSTKVKQEGEEILEDAKELRSAIKSKSGGIVSFIKTFLSVKKRRK